MQSVDPELIIRLGTHAEKEYLEKMIGMLDGFMVAANLMEATPNATSSLLVKLGGKKKEAAYYLDPMTYGYGLDLEYLKSEQKVKGETVWAIKRSYRDLAERLGGVFKAAVDRDEAISPEDLADDKVLVDTCRSVAEYQLNRPGTEWASDPEFAHYSSNIPKPAAVLTPYFFVDDRDDEEWLDLIPRIAKATVGLKLNCNVHSVVCADESLLYEDDALEMLADRLGKSGVDGVWLWFSNFDEHSAQPEQLTAYRELIVALSEKMAVYTMHGGYFSLALSRFGLTGTAHGVGYGEKKDVEPVQGQSTPTVRYYLPDVRKRLGVPDIERAFKKLGIKNPEDFHREICDCAICRGVLKDGLRAFSTFGELHYATAKSTRRSQTSTAAKLCRFHFLIRRIKERDQLKSQSLAEIRTELGTAWAKWSKQPTIANDADHLVRWIEALEEPNSERSS